MKKIKIPNGKSNTKPIKNSKKIPFLNNKNPFIFINKKPDYQKEFNDFKIYVEDMEKKYGKSKIKHLRMLYDYERNYNKQKKNIDSSIRNEVRSAMNLITKKAKQDKRLPLLFFIDPIQTLKDSNIELSNKTKEYLIKKYRWRPGKNRALYKGVKNGSVKISWIKNINIKRQKK